MRHKTVKWVCVRYNQIEFAEKEQMYSNISSFVEWMCSNVIFQLILWSVKSEHHAVNILSISIKRKMLIYKMICNIHLKHTTGMKNEHTWKLEIGFWVHSMRFSENNETFTIMNSIQNEQCAFFSTSTRTARHNLGKTKKKTCWHIYISNFIRLKNINVNEWSVCMYARMEVYHQQRKWHDWNALTLVNALILSNW